MKKQEVQIQKEQKPTIKDRIHRLFNRPLWDPLNNFWSGEPLLSESVFSGFHSPSVDISETKKEIHIKADVPGFKPEDISVETDENMLIIQGKTEEKTEEKDEQYLRRERTFGEFQRSFTLPKYADMEKIDCVYRNGILRVTIPKKQIRTSSKKVTVKGR